MMMKSTHSLLDGLNPQQMQAVSLNSGSMLILAGAGSGKTRVLTTRIAWLLATSQIKPHNILAVTFTNKAAKEIDTRISAMVGFGMKAMWMGTFHGLCHRLLRIHFKEANLPKTFQILDNTDQLSVIRRLLKTQQLSEELLAPRLVQYFINRHKEAGERANFLEAKNQQDQQLITLFQLYDEYCQQQGLVDFAELLLRSHEMMRSNPLLVEHYQQRFLHVLVDEFQDTNLLQYQWLKHFIGKESALFAVGDDDQSIYGFRGAAPSNMVSLLKDYHIANPIRLEQNYRSVGNVLAAANAVIKKNTDRLDKALWTQDIDGEPLNLLEAATDKAEVAFIVKEVDRFYKAGIPLDNIAVLYRSNAQSRLFEQALFDRGIPYRIYGGLRFFERQEIKHAIAYLRLMVNPEDNDALLRVINVPTRGIGLRTFEGLIDSARQFNTSLWGALKLNNQLPDKLANFVTLIEYMHALTAQMALSEMIRLVVAHSGLKAMYEQNLKDHTERLENLEELMNAAVNFKSDDEQIPLVSFLNNAALESGEYQAQHGQKALQLMTVHAAKGLEFDTVFVSGLEEGLFPHENSLVNPQETQEERRLMYVAMTRAKRQLYLTCAKQRVLHGRFNYPMRSRFIDDIPSQLIKVLFDDYLNFSPTFRHKNFTKEYAKIIPSDLPYRIGQTVMHQKFGLGVITDAEKMGEAFRLAVNFAKSGPKWLDTTYAKLQIFDESTKN
jgi:DNA helicase-2/ATP-dependent DNA helicase PcrA